MRRLLPDHPRYYINDTGTGNTLNVSHGRVMQMVLDSLRYWVEQTRVDGFRFDLGTILAREPNGFDNQSGFLKACTQDPVLNTVKLIAEPWDCGPGGYQVGEFPPGWAEWNDKYRDTVRDFWRGHAKPHWWRIIRWPLAQDRRQSLAEVAGGDSFEIERRNQSIDTGYPAHIRRQNRAAKLLPISMANPRLTNLYRANPRSPVRVPDGDHCAQSIAGLHRCAALDVLPGTRALRSRSPSGASS